MSLFEKSKEGYRAVYLEGRPIPVNRGMALGKEIADALEKDEDTGDIIKDAVIAQLPKYELRDEKLLVAVRDGKGTVPILIKPDSMRDDYSAILEYKTGTTAWNKAKVDKDDQLTFYATGIWALTGRIPALELVWAPTELVDGKPELTGDIRRFETSRRHVDVLRMVTRMRTAWKEIGELVAEMV